MKKLLFYFCISSLTTSIHTMDEKAISAHPFTHNQLTTELAQKEVRDYKKKKRKHTSRCTTNTKKKGLLFITLFGLCTLAPDIALFPLKEQFKTSAPITMYPTCNTTMSFPHKPNCSYEDTKDLYYKPILSQKSGGRRTNLTAHCMDSNEEIYGIERCGDWEAFTTSYRWASILTTISLILKSSLIIYNIKIWLQTPDTKASKNHEAKSDEEAIEMLPLSTKESV